MSQLLTPQQVAQILQVSLDTVYRILGSGQLKGSKVGTGKSMWRVSEEDLNTYLDSRVGKPEK